MKESSVNQGSSERKTDSTGFSEIFPREEDFEPAIEGDPYCRLASRLRGKWFILFRHTTMTLSVRNLGER